MTFPASSSFPSPFEAVILDHNGVTGVQPGIGQWEHLAALADWPAARLSEFQKLFWSRREAYDAGAVSTFEFWTGMVRDARPLNGTLVEELSAMDVSMWIRTDPAVLDVLYATRSAWNVPMVMLSNAPLCVADALDRSPWRRDLMSEAVFSARLGLNKPDHGAYEAALAAAGSPDPRRTLFVDDRRENCAAAAALGLATLHYQGDAADLARRLSQGSSGPIAAPARLAAEAALS
ncbi:HAD-IA family hydrolase [Streptomyces bobili]|uniref:HAD-IA family hydrolase n=1 Tax=Streptomyces bobili TaxID=67280 RepID=UPI00342140C9